MTVFINAEAAAKKTGAKFIDTRFNLTDPTAGQAAYKAGHIPNAHYFDLNYDLSAPLTPSQHQGFKGGRHPLPNVSDFKTLCSNHNLALNDEIIVYDQAAPFTSARLWWMLREVGFNQVFILDGGFNAWQENGLDTSTHHTPVNNTSQLSFECIFNIIQYDDLEKQIQLVDARATERFDGTTEPLDPFAGHIPNAINLPFTDNFNEHGRLKEDTLLIDIWAPILKAESTTHYCGSGVTACINIAVATHLKATRQYLYAGGWSDWCSYSRN